MRLDRDFSEFIECCIDHEVRFLIVGGYAVAFHGHPRMTKDLDVWVWVDRANADRLVAALEQFGFDGLGLASEDFLVPEQVVQLGYAPKRIDILTSIDGVEFAECYERRVEADLDGVAVPFIDLSGLRRNKRAAGRAQDLADLEALEE